MAELRFRSDALAEPLAQICEGPAGSEILLDMLEARREALAIKLLKLTTHDRSPLSSAIRGVLYD